MAIAGFFTASSFLVFAFVYWRTVTYASAEVDHEVSQMAYAMARVSPSYVDRRLDRWLAEDAKVERYGLLLDASGRFVTDDVAKEVAPGLADRLTTLDSDRGQERIFVLEGYEGATIRAIAAEASINPAMVIRYYGSKEGLFAAVAKLDFKALSLTGVPLAHVLDHLSAFFHIAVEQLDRIAAELRQKIIVTVHEPRRIA